ncbi:MAG: GldG family protein, partial [Panacagrimonas sp.]
LEGHGERGIGDAEQHGYAEFANFLRDKGLKVQALNLATTPRVPDNTAVLVLAAPERPLLAGEVKLIEEYVQAGGNLLWLADPDTAPGLKPVADRLGITWQDGYAVFPEYELLGTGHPGIFAALDYPANPVTRGLDLVTLFPLVRSLVTNEKTDGGWNAQPLLTSSPEAWLETQPISEDGVSLDPKAGDIAGPLTIGLTLTRERPDPSAPPPAPAAKEGEPAKPAPTRQQRVVLVGDADFISDGSLGKLGNQQLGLNIVQWLASRDSQLDIDVPKAPDTNLFLPNWAIVLIGGGFVIVLPLLLIGIGVTRWILRRRR